MKKFNLPLWAFVGFILLVLIKKFFLGKTGSEPGGTSPALPSAGQLTETISQSWLGKFLSNLDLSFIPFYKSVVELVGATWAPVLVLIVAVVLIAAVIWLIRKGEGAILVVVLMAALSYGAFLLVQNYIEKKTSSVINLDMRTVMEGKSVFQTILPTTTVVVLVTPADSLVHGYTRTWACPVPQTNVEGLMFEIISPKGSNPFHVALTEESRKLLPEGEQLEVKWTIVYSLKNDCRFLKVNWA